MPKGQKVIDWTAENDTKLFLTILALENIHPNCEKVAKAFGGSVNAMTISNRLIRLRRKAAEDGLVPEGVAAAPAKGRKSSGASKDGNEGKKGGMVAERSEVENHASDHEGSDSAPSRKTSAKGQKVLTGRITKAHYPAKKNAKSNDKISDNVEADFGNNGLDAAEGSGGENNVLDGEDVAAHIKDEEE